MATHFTSEQQRVIDTWGQGMAVLAGAGSGKTTTLVSKCIRLLELHPQARFAAVSFTERSAGDLRAKLAGVSGLHHQWITTIHGLCRSVISEFPLEAGFEGEESVMSGPESLLLWERALSALWFDEIPADVQEAFEFLLDREGRASLNRLLTRLRELSSFQVLESLAASSSGSSGDPSPLALAKVGRYVLERYERLKRRRGVLDFNDLEKGAFRALGERRVREAYHRRFDLVLVDEFQDTNSLQAQLLWRFSRPDLSNICVVGDPKQSIYRFRDADVSVFDEYCRRLPVRHSLTLNFRSRPGIIEFTNRICARIFPASDMEFEALVPQRPDQVPPSSVVRIEVSHPFALADWILGEVQKGIPLHEMTLLVRKVRGKEKWFKALTSRGIPLAIGSGGLFWEDPRVRELVAFLRWWNQPGHALSGGVFLRAPWMGISDQELDQWIQLDPTWRNPFFASAHPIAQALRGFLNKSVRPGELLMALLIDEEIEAELGTQLLSLWHRVENDSADGLDFHGVVLEISRAVEESRRERDVPAPRSLGQLSVLTLHGSKGLEFPHVILIDFGERPVAADMPLLFWDRTQGTYLGRRNEDGERDRESLLELHWRALEKKKELAESKRLFYVALTRAQERLVFVCSGLLQSKAPFDPEQAFYIDDWRAWLECYGGEIHLCSLPESVEPLKCSKLSLPKPSFFRASFPQRLMRARHSVSEWVLLDQCPRAYEWTYIRPVIFIEPPQAAQKQGMTIHRHLESGKIKTEDPQLQRTLEEWMNQTSWMQPTDLTQGRKVWTELNFEVDFEGEILVGSIDRLVRETQAGARRFWLIDFKVSDHSKSVRTLLETYRVQMELYILALKQLDPSLREDEVQGLLVHLSPERVQTVRVPQRCISAAEWIRKADSIIQGAPGEPTVGFYCKYCSFLEKCSEGGAYRLLNS